MSADEQNSPISFDKAAAERRADRIATKLDTIADNYVAVMPMIREAIQKQDYNVLGYVSASAYVSDRFGGALMKLGVDVRREVVKELKAAGLSTRAIAPVVGVGDSTVHRDLHAGAPHGAPVRDLTPGPQVNAETGEVSDDFEPPAEASPADDTGINASTDEDEDSAPSPSESTPAVAEPEGNRAPHPNKVTGLDGKTYPVKPKQAEPKPTKPRRAPITKSADRAGWDLRKCVDRLQRVAEDDRFEPNKEAMTPLLRGHLVNAIEVCQDLLDRITQEAE